MSTQPVSAESRPDLDGLVAALLPLAEDQLRKRPTFAPFAASVATDGNVTLAMAYDDAEALTTNVLISMLEEGLRAQATTRKIRACGICYDGRLRPASGGNPQDAVLINLEHERGEALQIARPYSRRPLRGIAFAEIIALPATPSIFLSTSDDAA